MKHTLSANTLFHFTKSSDNLVGILKNEFHPKYCLEKFDIVLEEVPEMHELAIPMVSFCDIPLSQIKNHIEYYGKYAIGLTKKWGIKNGISPILYTYKGSDTSLYLKNILVNTLRNQQETTEKTIIKDWYQLIRFLKPYTGNLWREGNYRKEKICFYDEREWRFCPYIPVSQLRQEGDPMIFMSKNDFSQPNIIKTENNKLEKHKLTFEPKDIKYIIVDKENEVLDMVHKVIEIKQKKYSYGDLQVLTTRIVSMEHILEDF